MYLKPTKININLISITSGKEAERKNKQTNRPWLSRILKKKTKTKRTKLFFIIHNQRIYGKSTYFCSAANISFYFSKERYSKFFVYPHVFHRNILLRTVFTNLFRNERVSTSQTCKITEREGGSLVDWMIVTQVWKFAWAPSRMEKES